MFFYSWTSAEDEILMRIDSTGVCGDLWDWLVYTVFYMLMLAHADECRST